MALDLASLSPADLEKVAAQLESTGDYGRAATVLIRLAAVKPQDVAVQSRLGRAFVAVHAHAEGEKALRKAMSLHKRPDAGLLALLGAAVVGQERYAEGVTHLRASITAGNNDINAHIMLARALVLAGERSEAEIKFAQLRKANPGNAQIPFFQAQILIDRKMFAEAIEPAETAIALGMKNEPGYVLLGQASAKSGDLHAAYDAYHAAIALKFKSTQAHRLWMADVVDALGLEKAVDWLATKDEKRSNPANSYHLAYLAFRAGLVPLSSNAFTHAASTYSEAPQIIELGARLAAVEGRWQEAVGLASRIWDLTAARHGIQMGAPPPIRPPAAPATVHRLVYSSVEVFGREFESRFLMACRAAGLGVSTVIATSHLFTGPGNAAELPPGVMLMKTMNSYDRRKIAALAPAGHRFVALDEEAMGWANAEMAVETGVDPHLPTMIDLVLANNEAHREALLRLFPVLEGKIHAAGNSRIELFNRLVSETFQPEADRLTAQFGRAVLICTSFCGFLGAHHDYVGICGVTFDAINRSPETHEGKMVVQLGKDAAVAESRNIAAFSEFMPKLAEAYPELTFIVRPHPAESPEIWKRRFHETKNIVVTGEGSLQAWLKAAKAMIYFSGCTTGFEAHLSGTPAIRFDVDPELAFPAYNISAHLNPSASDGDELIDRVGQAISGNLFDGYDRAQDEARAASQTVTGFEMPSVRTARAVAGYLDSAEALPVTPEVTERIRACLEEGTRRLITGGLEVARLFEGKRIAVSLGEIEEKLVLFRKAFPDIPQVSVRELTKGAFLVGPL